MRFFALSALLVTLVASLRTNLHLKESLKNYMDEDGMINFAQIDLQEFGENDQNILAQAMANAEAHSESQCSWRCFLKSKCLYC